MSKHIYIDESGYLGDYIFVAVCVSNPAIPNIIIKRWRKWMKHRIKNFNQNEYHDYDASADERRKILREIATYENELAFYTVMRKGYNGNHKEFYVPTMSTLLSLIEIDENADCITVDRIERRKNVMDRYLRQIKSALKQPGINLCYEDSMKEKGLQVADAIAGTISRELLPRATKSHYALISNQAMKKPVEIQ